MIPLAFIGMILVAQRTPIIIESMILDWKPVAILTTDPPLRKHQKERFNARLAAVQSILNTTLINAWYVGPPKWKRLLECLPQLCVDGAELENDQAARVKWYEFRLVSMKYLEWTAWFRVEVGNDHPYNIHFIRAARIDAEIDLLKLKDSHKGEK